MRAIPKPLLAEMLADPFYKRCARRNGECEGRITLEHALIYAGKQINERWAILPLCWHHHLGTGLNKGINQFIALRRATPEDLAKYPRTNWKQMRAGLEVIHGNK